MSKKSDKLTPAGQMVVNDQHARDDMHKRFFSAGLQRQFDQALVDAYEAGRTRGRKEERDHQEWLKGEGAVWLT